MGKTFYEVSCFNGVGNSYSRWFDDHDKAYEFYWSTGIACKIRAHHFRSEKKIFAAEQRVSAEADVDYAAYERQIAEDLQRSRC